MKSRLIDFIKSLFGRKAKDNSSTDNPSLSNHETSGITYSSLRAFSFSCDNTRHYSRSQQELLDMHETLDRWLEYHELEDSSCVDRHLGRFFTKHQESFIAHFHSGALDANNHIRKKHILQWKLLVIRMKSEMHAGKPLKPLITDELPEEPAVQDVAAKKDDSFNACSSVIGENTSGDKFAPIVPPATSALIEKNKFTMQQGVGRQAYDPVNVNSAFHNGYMYYPVDVLVGVENSKQDKNSQLAPIAEKVETIVVRSDRTVHRAIYSEMPEDRLNASRVIRLEDGTLIDKLPSANIHGTWQWSSITKYLAGDSVDSPSLTDLLYSVHSYLCAKVWLPNKEDYWMLTLIAAASYIQSVFEAVPLVLLNGPAGSGKSELSTAICNVSANSVMIGETSPATIMRLIDECSGLVVIDDLESIGGASGNRKGKEKFSEIIQVLKTGYRKSTARRVITDRGTHKTTTLNFFGIKVLSNTRGVDSILGSRMLRVFTSELPESSKSEFLSRNKVSDTMLPGIRNHFHTWAFNEANSAHKTYLRMYSSKTNREEEISAPLRVIAEMSGDRAIINSLELALAAQASRKRDPEDPISILRSAVESLIIDGYNVLSITHLMLEMKSVMSRNGGSPVKPWLKPEWVGRQLRLEGLIDPRKPAFRQRLLNSNLRFINLNPTEVSRIRMGITDAENLSLKSAISFCRNCDACKYASLGCELLPKRAEMKQKERELSTA